MKRWWLVIALLLSVGINAGILATLAFQSRSHVSAPSANLPPTDPQPVDPDLESLEDPTRLGGRLPGVIRRMADELDLKGEKRAAFTEIQRTFFEQTLAARSRMARLQQEIRVEVTAADPDRDALEALLLELSTAHTDLERAFIHNLLDSRELLDRQQERRFMAFLGRLRSVRGEVERRFRERWRGRMGREPAGLGPRGRRPGSQRFERPEPSNEAEPRPSSDPGPEEKP